MNYEAINFAEKFALFSERWRPKVVAEMNDYQFKIVNSKAISFGTTIRIRTRPFSYSMGLCGSTFGTGRLRSGRARCSSVPKGIEHKPYAEREVKLLLIEPRGVLNTGHEGSKANGAERRLDLNADEQS